MRFLLSFAAAGIPVLVTWVLLMQYMTTRALVPKPTADGLARHWEKYEDRTRTKRLNAIIEEESFLRAA